MSKGYINKNSELNDTGKWGGAQDKTWGQDIQEAKEKY